MSYFNDANFSIRIFFLTILLLLSITVVDLSSLFVLSVSHSTQEVSQVNLNPGKKVKINSQTPYAIKAISASSTRSTPPAASSVPSRTPSVISSSSQVSKPRAIPPSKSSAKPSPTFPSTFKPTQPKLSSSNSNTSRKSAVYNKPCR